MVVDQKLDRLSVFFCGDAALDYRAGLLTVADLEDENRRIRNRNIQLEALQKAGTKTVSTVIREIEANPIPGDGTVILRDSIGGRLSGSGSG